MGGLHLVSWRLNRKRIPSCSPPLSKKEFSTSLPSDFICSFNSLVLQAQSSTLALLGLRPDSPSCRFWTCQAPWSQKLIPYNCILSLSLSTHTHTHTHIYLYIPICIYVYSYINIATAIYIHISLSLHCSEEPNLHQRFLCSITAKFCIQLHVVWTWGLSFSLHKM